MLVIDTSVVIKWFVPEEGSSTAKKLLTESLAAPDLLLYEFANYLSQQEILKSDDRRFLMQTLYKFSVEYFVLPEDAFQEVIDFSASLRITSYDASFIILAKRLNTNFITADKKLVQKTRSLKFVHSLY